MNDGQLLTILIPTYNHPSYIADILNKYKDLLKFNVFLDIYDASENDETYRIIQKYSFSTLRYFSLPGVSLDERTLIALSSARTPYLFLCGDGYMLTERGYLRVKEYIEKGFDVIEMYDLAIPKDVTYYRSLQAKYNKDPIIYREVKQHFCDNFWHMPFYGGSIVKADAYKDGYSNYRESIGSLFSNVYSLYKFYS
jgi:hypothetical protein